MLFELDESHALLRDMVESVCVDASERIARIGDDGRRDVWQKLGELDVLGAPLPTNVGGGGGGPVDMMVIMQALGKHLMTVPYVSTIACAAQLLAESGSEAQIEKYLSSLISGESTVAFCAFEEGDRGQVTGVKTTATLDRGGYRIDGGKSAVLGADRCDSLLVVAELRNVPGEYAAFFVAPDAPGVVSRHRRTIDGSTASEISFDGVFVPTRDCLGSNGIREQLELVYDLAVIGMCAEACGSMDAMIQATIDYVGAREQFGQPVGRFQVVQHRVVDMHVLFEQATAVTHWAALSLGLPRAERRRPVAAAKAYVGGASRKVAQSAVQLHGAIGTTDELALSRHLRRIEVFNTQFGATGDHVNSYLSALDMTPLRLKTGIPTAVR
jgi:alkylation response protein AidB-like acyl-CoA dehydrogenase